MGLFESSSVTYFFPSSFIGSDGFEHDGTLGAVGMTIRGGARFRARLNRATTLYPVGART
jgi:hypothetical protein